MVPVVPYNNTPEGAHEPQSQPDIEQSTENIERASKYCSSTTNEEGTISIEAPYGLQQEGTKRMILELSVLIPRLPLWTSRLGGR